MDLLALAEAGLSVGASVLSIIALYPVARQAYRDHMARWPYEVRFGGLLKQPAPSFPKSFRFQVKNLTSKPAYFTIRTRFGDIHNEVPFHVSVWPTQEKVALYLTVPPREERVLGVSPFGPQRLDLPTEWKLAVGEYFHPKSELLYAWPADLNLPVQERAEEIPTPS